MIIWYARLQLTQQCTHKKNQHFLWQIGQLLYNSYLLTRFTSAGSMSVRSVSPSASSSSDSSLDEPLVDGLTATTGFFCTVGMEGTPSGILTSLSCNIGGSFPEGADPT